MRNAPSSSNVVRFPRRSASFPRRPLAPMRNALTCLSLFRHGETDRALKVSDCGDKAKAVWLPKAMLIVESGPREGVIVATLPVSIAEQNHLWPRFVDREGWSEARVDAFNEAEALAARKRNRLRNHRASSLGHFGRNLFA